jgi:glycosyltransferase involved in cell wall biosynthesis
MNGFTDLDAIIKDLVPVDPGSSNGHNGHNGGSHLLSVIIPIHNEEANIPLLHEELTGVLLALGHDYEVIAVDDGSTDASYEALRAIHQRDPNWQAISLARNYGQSAALAAGFDLASGEVIVTIDGDLQNDPHDIPRLLEVLESGGYDVVSGWRRARKGSFLKRRLPSMVANGLISRLTGVRLHDYGCTLKVYRREALRDVTLYGELHRFIPALVYQGGARIAEVPVNDRERRFGRSKYGIGRVIRVIPDLLGVVYYLRYRNRAMILFGALGLGLSLIGLLGLFATLALWLAGRFVSWLLVVSVMTVLGGLHTTLLGLLMESQSRSAHAVRPPYQIRERLNREYIR